MARARYMARARDIHRSMARARDIGLWLGLEI